VEHVGLGGPPGAICQMFASEASVSAGKRIDGVSGRCQLAAKSSEHTSSAPKCSLFGAAQRRRRPARSSKAIA
jgi:hypothetical protein